MPRRNRRLGAARDAGRLWKLELELHDAWRMHGWRVRARQDEAATMRRFQRLERQFARR